MSTVGSIQFEGDKKFRYHFYFGDDLKNMCERPIWIELADNLTRLCVLSGQICAVELQEKEDWKHVFSVENGLAKSDILVLGGNLIIPVMDYATNKKPVDIVDNELGVKLATVYSQ